VSVGVLLLKKGNLITSLERSKQDNVFEATEREMDFFTGGIGKGVIRV
jgi:hypothetical protein